MNTFTWIAADFAIRTSGFLQFFIYIIALVVLAGVALYAIQTWITDAMLQKLLKFVVVVVAAILVVAVLLGLGGCTQPEQRTPQQTAAIQTASNLARIAVEAAATYYGGQAGGQLASAGLDGAAAVLQAYVGDTIPPEVLKSSPGVQGVGAVMIQQIAPNHVVSQSDVNRVNQAAAIAATLKPAIVTP